MATSTIDRPKSGLDFLPKVPRTGPMAPAQPQMNRVRKKRAARSARAPADTVITVPGETQETRRAKTLRIGQARVVNILRGMRLWGNTAGRNYDWTETEWKKQGDAILAAFHENFAKFDKGQRKVLLEDTFDIRSVVEGKNGKNN